LICSTRQQYKFGAFFVHSSQPAEDLPENTPKRGIHTLTFSPKTLAELHYKEEHLDPSGEVDTASIEAIRKLARLPWRKTASFGSTAACPAIAKVRKDYWRKSSRIAKA
jgi:hypothetical protein